MKPTTPAAWLISICLIIGTVLSSVACSAIPPANDDPQANLTAQKDTVTRTRGEDSTVVVPANTAVEIQVNDKVDVDEAGRGILRLASGLQVDIFRDTTLQLENYRRDPGDILFITLRQVAGHTQTDLQEEINANLVIVTDFATITSLGTSFAICHDPAALTCLVVLEGTTEVEAEGTILTVNGGEAAYIFPGMPPIGPICADLDQVEEWLDQKRAAQDIPPLGELVSNWPQVPCGEQVEVGGTGAPSTQGMVTIDAGQYEVGLQNGGDTHLAPQQVELAAYWIDIYEVTNADYLDFINATGALHPIGGIGTANHPVKGVTWDEAAAYCAWVNKRLPSEAEWEVAARGPGSPPSLYPWGDNPMADNQVNELPRSETYPVGSHAFNQTVLGVFDMAGNVWEWVGDSYGGPPLGTQKILRGGRHGLLTDMAYRQLIEPDADRFVQFAGFRCAADLAEGE